MATRRTIIVHLPQDISDDEHADIANAVWAVASGASSIEVTAPDSDEVNRRMDDLWKAAPEWDGKAWSRPTG